MSSHVGCLEMVRHFRLIAGVVCVGFYVDFRGSLSYVDGRVAVSFSQIQWTMMAASSYSGQPSSKSSMTTGPGTGRFGFFR